MKRRPQRTPIGNERRPTDPGGETDPGSEHGNPKK